MAKGNTQLSMIAVARGPPPKARQPSHTCYEQLKSKKMKAFVTKFGS